MRIVLGVIAALGLLNLSVPARAAEPKSQPARTGGAVSFQKDIASILTRNCSSCHGEAKRKGGLRIDSLEAILEGGNSGPAIVPGKGSKSLLVRKSDEDDPTPHKGRTLTADQLALLKSWIDQGARATDVEAKPKKGKGSEVLVKAPPKGKAKEGPTEEKVEPKGKKNKQGNNEENEDEDNKPKGKAAEAPSKGKAAPKGKAAEAPSKGKPEPKGKKNKQGNNEENEDEDNKPKGKAAEAPSKGKAAPKGKAAEAPSKGKAAPKGKAAEAPSKGKPEPKGKKNKQGNNEENEDEDNKAKPKGKAAEAPSKGKAAPKGKAAEAPSKGKAAEAPSKGKAEPKGKKKNKEDDNEENEVER